ncbi:sugar ABC transporter substrate-binding protein [Paenibacillaceae bacterium]|nr:sugar ABC transporter substrate-binding protein [Paenibacillaceae bacterium]
MVREENAVKKIIAVSLYTSGGIMLFVFAYFTFKVVQSHPAASYDPQPIESDIYRIVFISGDSGSPFWNRVKEGVYEVASHNQAAIEFKETFHADFGEYLKSIDMAIAARVDGIIVQGKENPDFIRIVNKASQKGIAVITVFTDAPDSLRKSYVGPNHYQEGVVIGEHIAAQLDEEKKVCLVYGAEPIGYLSLRKKGLQDALGGSYPQIELVEAPLSVVSEQDGLKESNELLNLYPECRAIVGLTVEAVDGIVQVIKARNRIQDYHIFAFDQDQESFEFFDQGIISAAFYQYPEEIGAKSMKHILRWLEGKDNPLDRNYFTPVELISKKSSAP